MDADNDHDFAYISSLPSSRTDADYSDILLIFLVYHLLGRADILLIFLVYRLLGRRLRQHFAYISSLPSFLGR